MDVASPSLYFGWPDSRILQFPPDVPPAYTRPASLPKFSWDRAISIPPSLYDYSLKTRTPLLTAIVYVLVVWTFNGVNRRRGFRSWPLSQTRAFYVFTLLHNAGLTVLSVWAFIGICFTVRSSLPPPTSSPYLVHVADVLCQLDRVVDANISHAVRPGSSTQPEILPSTSLWEGGIGYFTWIFYASKFYEIIDTLLVLVKGKRVSFLQIYHHAGVIVCTWLGLLYRPPPAVVGIAFNTGVHSLMYFYYFLATLRVPIPPRLKRALTTIQIAQFIIGGSMGLSFAFIVYDMPLDLALASYAPEKQLSSGENMVVRHVSCLQNSGQLFAVLLGIGYLIPLTHLFVRFFSGAYLSLSKQKTQ